MTAKEIAQAAGVSAATVYKRAKQLGRLPTVEEVQNTRKGRPKKYEEYKKAYNEIESMSGHPIDIPGYPSGKVYNPIEAIMPKVKYTAIGKINKLTGELVEVINIKPFFELEGGSSICQAIDQIRRGMYIIADDRYTYRAISFEIKLY